MDLTTKFSMKYPIIQAPMAGITTPEMVVASLEAGILGAIGAGYLSAEQTRSFIRSVKAKTQKPFMINLFAYELPPIVQHEISIAKQALVDAKIDEQVSRDEVTLSTTTYYEQLDVVMEEGVAVCSFTFGLPTLKQVQQLQEKNIEVWVTATSRDEIIEAHKLPVDAIILQGCEAGGHRGSFIQPYQMVQLSELVDIAQKITGKPLIAAGGISTKQQMENFLAENIAAVVLGTLLVVSDESAAASAYKDRILQATSDETVLTKMFSGRPARSINNNFIEKMEMMPVAAFPYQNDLTKNIRARAAQNNNLENMSLWAGKNLYLAEKGSIQEIIERFMTE